MAQSFEIQVVGTTREDSMSKHHTFFLYLFSKDDDNNICSFVNANICVTSSANAIVL